MVCTHLTNDFLLSFPFKKEIKCKSLQNFLFLGTSLHFLTQFSNKHFSNNNKNKNESTNEKEGVSIAFPLIEETEMLQFATEVSNMFDFHLVKCVESFVKKNPHSLLQTCKEIIHSFSLVLSLRKKNQMRLGLD
jgi:hypothetical protein